MHNQNSVGTCSLVDDVTQELELGDGWSSQPLLGLGLPPPIPPNSSTVRLSARTVAALLVVVFPAEAAG